MKHITIAAILMMAAASYAQTSPTGSTSTLEKPTTTSAPAPGSTASATATSTSSSSTGNVWNDVKQLGVDAYSALKGINFTNGVVVEPFGIDHSGDFGGGLVLRTGNTNGLNAGFAFAAIDESSGNLSGATAQNLRYRRHGEFLHRRVLRANATTGGTPKSWDFYDASLSVSWGTTFLIPVLNLPAYPYIETGPAANLASATTVLEQSATGVDLMFGNWTIGGGIVQNSAWGTSPGYIFQFSYKF